MRLMLSGFPDPVNIGKGASVLEIHNKALFSRVCQSLCSEMGDQAVEPFSLWDGEKKRSARNAFLIIGNPFELPWEERSLLGDFQEKVEDLYYSEDSARREIDEAAQALRERIASLGLRFQSEYDFAIEWDIGKYLKAFDFSVEEDFSDTLFDNLIRFVHFLSDIQYNRVVVFLNLKSFLEESELEEFFDAVFFSNLNILLMESWVDVRNYAHERKIVIDEDLLFL